ncbi:uncharacterized protein LOC124672486 [Lolium rigidum]|uniref:uncharacterized protein LOC124672486 n=1 Tax=Lolium rigidum TaxID=89674 RepID=UPI001F5C6425|nr:uncharacterized protein LOC124672486 [Lolium rigidum]
MPPRRQPTPAPPPDACTPSPYATGAKPGAAFHPQHRRPRTPPCISNVAPPVHPTRGRLCLNRGRQRPAPLLLEATLPLKTNAVLELAHSINHIVLLSGTPSLSRPFDIYHQINMLRPNLLGHDKFEFARTYCSLHVAQRSHGKTYQDFSKGARLTELNVLLSQTLMPVGGHLAAG